MSNELTKLSEKIEDYVSRVESFHKHLQQNFDIKEKQPVCSDGKPHNGEDWTMDVARGWRCKRCNVTWLEAPIIPPKWE